MKRTYQLSVTTQGPTYPPSEVMDENGNFVVVGYINESDPRGAVSRRWGAAIVDAKTQLPEFGGAAAYTVLRELELSKIDSGENFVLYTLPLPLPCNNYPMEFAPEQRRAGTVNRSIQPLHQAMIPDERPEDGRRKLGPITIRQWLKARGELAISLLEDRQEAVFEFELHDLVPNSLYTVMALRARDLDPAGPTRPGPLGIPNAFIADENGHAVYKAIMPNPFPITVGSNRIVNVVVLWMSTQMSHGGAIGYYGLGGDVHAQLKLKLPSFSEFCTEKR